MNPSVCVYIFHLWELIIDEAAQPILMNSPNPSFWGAGAHGHVTERNGRIPGAEEQSSFAWDISPLPSPPWSLCSTPLKVLGRDGFYDFTLNIGVHKLVWIITNLLLNSLEIASQNAPGENREGKLLGREKALLTVLWGWGRVWSQSRELSPFHHVLIACIVSIYIIQQWKLLYPPFL